MNKSLLALILLLAVFTFSCKSKKTATIEKEPQFTVTASAQRYHAALGSGNGVIFLVYLHADIPVQRDLLKADSIIVNKRNIEPNLRADSTLIVEGNYFVPRPPKGDGQELPTIESADPVLFLGQYLPATLYLTYRNKPYALEIEEFESISE